MRAGAVLRGGEVLSKCLSSGSRRSCVSIGMFFVCLMPVIRSYRYVLRSITPVIRSYRYVLRSITPAVCRIAPNRTACDMLRSYSAVGRDRHSCVLGCRVVIRLCWFTSGLCVSLWRSRRRTKGREGRRTESAARQSAFLRDRIGFAMFSAGSPLGAARPQTCAKESSTLWTLFIWVAAWVRFTRRRAFGCNGDLNGSRERRPHCGWPGKACGYFMMPHLKNRNIISDCKRGAYL